MLSDAFTEPMHVCTVDGEVVVLGPNGISGAFTVEAARLSARNLLTAAAEADGKAARKAAGARSPPEEGP